MNTFIWLTIITSIFGIILPTQSQLNVKEISLSELLESQSATLTAYGMGQSSNKEMVYQQAKQQSNVMLLSMINGYNYEFQKSDHSFQITLKSEGDLNAPEKTDEWVLSSDPLNILMEYQLKDMRPNYPDNSFAYRYTIRNAPPVMFSTQLGKSVSQSISTFAESKPDTSFDSGKIWIHNIDVTRKRRSSELTITVTMIITTD